MAEHQNRVVRINDPNRKGLKTPQSMTRDLTPHRKTRVKKILEELLRRAKAGSMSLTEEAERFADGLAYHAMPDLKPEHAPVPAVTTLETIVPKKPELPKVPAASEPLRLENGTANPEHFRERYRLVNEWINAYRNVTGELPSKFREELRSIIEEAELFGVQLLSEMPKTETLLDHDDLTELPRQQLIDIGKELHKLPCVTPEQRRIKKKWRTLLLVMARLSEFASCHTMAGWTWAGRTGDKSCGVFDWQPFHIRDWLNRQRHTHTLTVMPPGSGKTELLLGTEAIMPLATNPEMRIHCVVGDEPHAPDWCQYVRNYMDNPRLRAIHPDAEVDRRQSDTAKQFTMKRKHNKKDPSFFCVGVLQGAEGYRSDRLIGDDVVQRKAMFESSYRKQVISAWWLTWQERLEPTGDSRLINTRWHDGDLMGDIIRKVRDDGMDYKVHVIAPERILQADGTAVPGKSHWASRFPTKLLRQKYVRDPSGFSCTHWGIPVMDGGQKVEQLRFYDQATWEPPIGERWLSVDPAGTEEDPKADETAIGHWLLCEVEGWPRMYLLDAWNVKIRAERIIEKVKPMLVPSNGEPRRADFILIERKGTMYRESYAYRELVRQIPGGQFRSYVPAGNRSKGDRLRWCAPLLENGTILFPGQFVTDERGREMLAIIPRLRWLADQILQFGSVNRDDGVDMTTQMVWHHHGFFARSYEAGDDSASGLTKEQQRLKAIYEQRLEAAREGEKETDDAEFFTTAGNGGL